MDNFSVRKLIPRDLKVYRKLRNKSTIQSPMAFSDHYNDIKDKDNSFFAREIQPIEGPSNTKFILGAFHNDATLCGFLHFHKDERQNARHKAMIHNMYVDVLWRDMGLGGLLLSSIFNIANSWDELQQIHCWVLKSKAYDASGFYKKYGFTIQGPVVKQDLIINGEYIDAYYMVKNL